MNDPEHDQEEAQIRLGNIPLPSGTTSTQRAVLMNLLRRLQAELRNCNPYVQDFIQACDMPAHDVDHAQLVISESARPQGEHARRYNRGFKEVSVLIGNEPGRRDFVLQLRQGGLKTIADTHRASDPLHFVLLFPTGTDGWHLGLKHVNPQTGDTTTKRVCAREFYAFHLQLRVGPDMLFRAKRLFQEYCCMAFATAENQRLSYIQHNQKQLRAEVYNNLCDMIQAHDASGAPGNPASGQRVILPPSFAGGPRDMHRRFQDAMAIVRKHHKPDLFVTFTCNPKWKEVMDAILPGQAPADRPDIVARVFKQKLRHFMEEITKRKIFGRTSAHLHVVEFQKRGLPHAHILVILHQDDRLHTADDVDRVSCAELPPDPDDFAQGSPERDQAQRLQDTVLQSMVHGPCGTINLKAPCMKNGVCQKGYPKPFCNTTLWNDNETYPTYRRRSPEEGGRQINHDGKLIDNQWIVPYNPYSTLRYGAHINCEACCSSLAAKYLFKYVHKGADRAMMRVEGNQADMNGAARDEVRDYQDMRSLGSSEACWRLFRFPLSDRHPAVYSMRVHLEDRQTVFYEEGQEREAAERDHTTELLGFFQYNLKHPGTAVTYCDFPERFTWHTGQKEWKPRQGAFDTIGRLLTIHPLAGEVYYLRILLNHDQCKGATCYDDLLTVDGQRHDTFQSACEALGLLQSDNEWDQALTEAATTQLCPQIRELYVTLLLFCNPADPVALFDKHHEHWWDDYIRRVPAPADGVLLRSMVLLDIEKRLQAYGKQLTDFVLPAVPDNVRRQIQELDGSYAQRHLPMAIQEELAYDQAVLTDLVANRLNGEDALLPSQRAVFETVIGAVKHRTPLAIFVDARGGTGKTYTLNTLLAATRTLDDAENNIALAVASSGIAATLLLGGRTFHSRFKAPINLTATSTLYITKQSAVADLIRRARLIVWDEAPMGHRHLLEALDRTLRDVTDLDSPFGGKVVVLAGDFRQVTHCISISDMISYT